MKAPTLFDFEPIFQRIQDAALPSDIKSGLVQFYHSYREICDQFPTELIEISNELKNALYSYITQITQEVQNPTLFRHYHDKERTPFDYFQFGISMVLPLVDVKRSYLLGQENIRAIEIALEKRENVIFFANHQAEIDPQIISILTAPYSQKLSEDIICVAGHRVTQDPLAIPFSRGRNLICIYSKKYIDYPPEEKEEKLLHNAKAMSAIESMLTKGGICIYVAPSGGRDRPSSDGSITPAAFDSHSIEMFRLLAKKSRTTTHFHLLALHTIDQLPPPKGRNISLGEARIAKRAPAGLFFSPAIDMTSIDAEIEGHLRPAASSSKQEIRNLRAIILHQRLLEMYKKLSSNLIVNL